MIEGANLKNLKVLKDNRGHLFEILRPDWVEAYPNGDGQIGQVYMTNCAPNAAKGWHYHKAQTDHFFCLRGEAVVVLFDERENSPTKGEVQEFRLKASDLQLLTIPLG